MPPVAKCLIALGANQSSPAGPPCETLQAAVQAMVERGAQVLAQSAFYKTPCFPAGAGPDYVNAAVAVEWALSARGVLDVLHAIEAEMGRARSTRWASRPVDLDLIAVGDVVAPNEETHAQWRDLPLADQMTRTPEELILPHPRMQDRAFVLVPLMDVAPDWRHPLLNKTVRQLCNALLASDRQEVQPA